MKRKLTASKRLGNSVLYDQWRTKVFERDKNKCRLCGKKGRINAHHIDGWNWAIGLRYSVENGITLCAKKGGCHDKFHSIYGRGNNTRYQFYEFVFTYFKSKLSGLK